MYDLNAATHHSYDENDTCRKCLGIWMHTTIQGPECLRVLFRFGSTHSVSTTRSWPWVLRSTGLAGAKARKRLYATVKPDLSNPATLVPCDNLLGYTLVPTVSTMSKFDPLPISECFRASSSFALSLLLASWMCTATSSPKFCATSSRLKRAVSGQKK
jgi:hypothetical protein